MFKKLFAIVLILFILPFAALPADAYAAEPTPPPAGSLGSGDFMFTLDVITHEGIRGSSRQGWVRQGINYLFERAISLMAAVIGTFAVVTMSIGGFLMISSGPSETQYEKGKTMLIYSMVGLAAVLGAYLLVTSVQLLIKSIWS